MKKILVLGSTGHIGSEVCKYLLSLGYEVDVMSRMEFMCEDFSRLRHFNNIESNDSPDVLVNCAWIKDDLQVTDHIEFAELVCNLYLKCKKLGIEVINIGSSSEYGIKFEPMTEDMPCEPVTAYGIGKLAVTLYAKLLGFNTLRVFTAYGNSKGKSLMDNRSTKKFGNRYNVRDYVSVQTIARAVERLIHAQHLHGEIINVCSGLETRHEEFMDDVEVQDCTYPQGQYEPYHWVGDNTKMRELLNL